MNKLMLKKSIKDIFNCEDGHKVLLCKSTKNEYMCLVCDNVVSVKENNNYNIIYTDKTDLELINSLSRIKYEFINEYYNNNESIEEAVKSLNGEKVKNKTRM